MGMDPRSQTSVIMTGGQTPSPSELESVSDKPVGIRTVFGLLALSVDPTGKARSPWEHSRMLELSFQEGALKRLCSPSPSQVFPYLEPGS